MLIFKQSDVSYKYKQAEGFVDQRCSFCNSTFDGDWTRDKLHEKDGNIPMYT